METGEPAMVKMKTHLELCIGCGQCDEQCPVAMANIVFEDEDGRPKIKTDDTICIACGRCIGVCPQKARYYGADE